MDAIIFDLDGTLWDSRQPVYEAWNQTILELTGHPWGISQEEFTALFGQPMDAIAATLFPDKSREEQAQLAQVCYDRENVYLSEHHGVLFPGVRETLEELAQRWPLYIVSNCQKGYIEVFLSTMGLEDLFQGFLCYGDTHASKDKTIRRLMKEHKLSDVVYVGDTHGDEKSCKKAEIPFIFAQYGFGQAKKPDRIIEDITQLPQVLGDGKKKLNAKREALSWLYTVILPIAVILLLNAFVGKLVVVNGSSMYPTLHHRDLMIVRTIAYTPKTGDIVVIKTDKNGILQGENIVKRCIATAGDTVWVDYDANVVYVNGSPLSEDYINSAESDVMEELYYLDTNEVTVPQGYIFVMGDNRNHSTDSRDPRLGLIPVDSVMGNTVFTLPTGLLFPQQDS